MNYSRNHGAPVFGRPPARAATKERVVMEAMHPDVDRVLFSKEDIADMVKRMGAQISKDYEGKDLVLIAVLRGAVVLWAI